jgi:predicted phosphodiesterase
MARDDPQRVLVAGDVHGNSRWMGSLCKLARRHGCEVILQLGDFGYWPHTPDGLRFLEHVDWHAERNDIDCIYWIDGNHDNHDALSALKPGAAGTVPVGKRCRYIPRGHRWVWSGVRFGALGGAFSVDRRERVRGESWWDGEVPARSDLESLGDAQLDVLVTHDAPAGSPVRGLALPAIDEVLAGDVRQLNREAMEATAPAVLLHGHWHHRYSAELTWPVATSAGFAWRSTLVEGLAADVQGDHRAWAVLELNPLRLVDPRMV